MDVVIGLGEDEIEIFTGMIRDLVHVAPVLIGHDADNDPAETDLLINLADEIPMFFSRFERVAEVVSEDKQSRESGRNRFRFYRDRGYDLRTHQLR